MKKMLADVQSQSARIPLSINQVGIRNLKLPFIVRQKDNKEGQNTVGTFSLSVELPADANGTHMSRFVDELQNLACASKGLDYSDALALLRKTCRRLNSPRAHLSIKFPFFLNRKAPTSSINALMCYQCGLEGEIDANLKTAATFSPFILSVTIPVMTVCPCSKAISSEGAHTQRAEIRVKAKMKAYIWIEDIIEIGEKCGSSPVYSLLKRPDEKYVTERAFSNPYFVEDVARLMALKLSENKKIENFTVEVESYESIHAHNAFALIKG